MISLASRPVVHNAFPRLTSTASSHLFSFSSPTMLPLLPEDLNPAILKVQYAVRGELAIKAEELREKLQTEKHDLPFKKVISSNIGNPQQKGLDQPALTFTRQVRLLAHRVGSMEMEEAPRRSRHSWSTRPWRTL